MQARVWGLQQGYFDWRYMKHRCMALPLYPGREVAAGLAISAWLQLYPYAVARLHADK